MSLLPGFRDLGEGRKAAAGFSVPLCPPLHQYFIGDSKALIVPEPPQRWWWWICLRFCFPERGTGLGFPYNHFFQVLMSWIPFLATCSTLLRSQNVWHDCNFFGTLLSRDLLDSWEFCTNTSGKNWFVLSYLTWYFQGFSSRELGLQHFACGLFLVVLWKRLCKCNFVSLPMWGHFPEENSRLGFLWGWFLLVSNSLSTEFKAYMR